MVYHNIILKKIELASKTVCKRSKDNCSYNKVTFTELAKSMSIVSVQTEEAKFKYMIC